ncbi:hypothetical protein PHSC3_001711 [Chlamydiales bacterium STE3]|nr:hypothetical protein PHSC3_001711 [Chlamydiales bacterium STE3]
MIDATLLANIKKIDMRILHCGVIDLNSQKPFSIICNDGTTHFATIYVLECGISSNKSFPSVAKNEFYFIHSMRGWMC